MIRTTSDEGADSHGARRGARGQPCRAPNHRRPTGNADAVTTASTFRSPLL